MNSLKVQLYGKWVESG